MSIICTYPWICVFVHALALLFLHLQAHYLFLAPGATPLDQISNVVGRTEICLCALITFMVIESLETPSVGFSMNCEWSSSLTLGPINPLLLRLEACTMWSVAYIMQGVRGRAVRCDAQLIQTTAENSTMWYWTWEVSVPPRRSEAFDPRTRDANQISYLLYRLSLSIYLSGSCISSIMGIKNHVNICAGCISVSTNISWSNIIVLGAFRKGGRISAPVFHPFSDNYISAVCNANSRPKPTLNYWSRICSWTTPGMSRICPFLHF